MTDRDSYNVVDLAESSIGLGNLEVCVVCATKVRNLVFSRGRPENPGVGTQTLNLRNLRIISSMVAASPLCNLRIYLRQFEGTSTYERSSSATDVQPSNLRVRSTSARKISKARVTPGSPA